MYLNLHSYYSLRYGTLSIDELIGLALRAGIASLALTDINTTMGIPEFTKKAEAAGLRPVAGCEFRNGDRRLYVALARNREGLKEINDWLTLHNLQQREFPPQAPPFRQVYVIYPFSRDVEGQPKLRDNEWTGVAAADANGLLTSARRCDISRMVVLQPVTFRDKRDWFLHKTLRAIDHNALISKLESANFAGSDNYFLPPEVIEAFFGRYPTIIGQSNQLLNDCSISFDFGVGKNRKLFTQSVNDDRRLLERLALEGMEYRYGKGNAEALRRVHHELQIIFQLGFASYFLIAWDIVRYGMSCGFYHVGRGSGANSVVAYCLKITDVDPIALDLYFERFLNPRRTSPPDFDIDYSWRDRETIQRYIFGQYGPGHCALLGATSTFRDRSIYREMGKVFGLPAGEIDLLVKAPDSNVIKNEITLLISTLARQVVDFPNMRTIHAGGVLITEEPITCYTALDLPPKGFPTTQWDMYMAEELGFEKFDILSQRGIGHIKEAVEIIAENRNETVDVHQVDRFFRDEQVKHQLRTGETTGCFYIESPAMRGLLNKLRCDNYLTLVAASSIIRPGVAKSGMMKEYILRFHQPERTQYLHPVMEQQLAETYGVMVYQEDVIKVAHHFAGLDLAEADVLRRAMSGKFRSRVEFQKIEDRYFANCRLKGYPDALSREVWRQIESFAGYSFSKAHSASYAVESFQSLFLKAHYPLEFMVAVINNFGGFYRSWVYFNEAERCGASIELPCINQSRMATRIVDRTIYIGFVHVQNLEQASVASILSARESGGQFASLADFVGRVAMGKEQLTTLIRLGALRFTGKNKAQLLWEAHLLLVRPVRAAATEQSIFPVEEKNYRLPELESSLLGDAYDEIELLGFPVSVSPFDMLETAFRGEITAGEMRCSVGRTVRMLGRLVTIKYVPTVRKEVMNFGTFIDVKGDFFDTVHFPPSLRGYPFRGDGVYLLLGRIVEEFGFPSLEVQKMAKMPFRPNPRA